MVGVVGAALAGVVPALVVRHVVNANLVVGSSNGLLASALAYVAAVAVGTALVFAYSYLAAVVAQHVIVTIRVALFSHLSRLPAAYLDQTPVGDMISRATADVETIDTLFTDGITTLVGQIVSLVVVASAMVVVSPLLSIVSLVVLPPLVLASRWIQVRVRRAERATRVAVGQVNAQLSETLGGAQTIQSFNREETFVFRIRRVLASTLVAQEASIRYNAFFTPVTGLLSSFAIALMLLVGFRGALGIAEVNLGTLAAFVLLFQSFFAPIVALGDQWNAVQAALAGVERVFEVLDLEVTASPPDATGAPRADGLVMDGVTFSYHSDATPVLKGVSLIVRPGERVAIVGRTGSGKSTLLSVSAGLYEPNSGTIVLAGRHPRGFDEAARRKAVGVVPQHVQLFSGTLRENVTLEDARINDEMVWQTLSLVGLESLVRQLPQGLDSVLAGSDDVGLALSAGQRQLVALARALVYEPNVLLLDEATAAIDAPSDASFRAALTGAAWSSRCAIVTVAHRIATARDADRVVVMEDGRIVEEGPPDTLVSAGGRFAALAALDAAGWSWEETVVNGENDPGPPAQGGGPDREPRN